ncbi:MAG: hypothetical protein AB7U97_02705, partial [Pirellulales bacterium]
MKLALLLKVPLIICSAPPVQWAVPSFCRMRLSVCVLPLLMFSVPPAPTIVVPLPDIVPLVQFNVPLTV